MVEPVDSVAPHRSKRIRNINIQDSKNHESSSNEASKLFMSIVTDDILSEILVRLTHATYAIRSSLVCKRWFSLVHHPQFTAEFSRQNRRRNETDFELFFRVVGPAWPDPETFSYRILITKNNNNIYPNSSSHGRKCPHVTFRASSGDLILLDYCATEERYLYNSITKKRLKLPHPTAQEQQLAIGIMLFKPLGRYKVAAVPQGHPSSLAFDIFSFCSQTQGWSRTEHPTLQQAAPLFRYRFQEAVSVGPALYFPFERDFVFAGVFLCRQMAAAATISCRFVAAPKGFRGGWMAHRKRVIFGAVSGRLRVSQMLKRKGVFSLKIWELSNDYEAESESTIAWVLVHDVRLRSGNNDKTRMFVVAFHPYNGDAVFVLRDCINICMYSNIGEGDQYEIVGRLPISIDKLSKFRKHNMFRYVTVFPLARTPWPTPV